MLSFGRRVDLGGDVERCEPACEFGARSHCRRGGPGSARRLRCGGGCLPAPARALGLGFETAQVSACLKVARQALDAVLDATATTGGARTRIAAQDRWLICRARERDDAEQRPYRRVVRCSDAAVPEPARGRR